MLIKFNAARILSFQNLTIVPGIQEIDDAIFAEMQAHKTTRAKLESGELEVIEGPNGLDAIGTFLLMKPIQVQKIIKDTNDLRLLSNWLAREARESVKELVKARIEILSVVQYRDGTKGKLTLPKPDPVDDLDDGKSLEEDDDIFGEDEPKPKKPIAKRRGK